jgi:hypothetical protein
MADRHLSVKIEVGLLWWVLIALIIVDALAGCTTRSTLAPDEFGKAAACHWINNSPYLCSYNPDRVTIDQGQLSDLLFELDYYRQQAYEKRKL